MKSALADCTPNISYESCFTSTAEARCRLLKGKQILEGFELKAAR